MNKIIFSRAGCFFLFQILSHFLIPALAAQPTQPTPTPPDTAACAACGTLAGGTILLVVAFFVLNIALLVWVARDAKSRGMDSAVLWMLLVFFTSLIGLIIYIFSRPQGNTMQCPRCNNRRLEASARCPHCGNS